MPARSIASLLLAAFAAFAVPAIAQETVIPFDEGWEGWSGPTGIGGSTVIEPEGGNPGANARTIFNDFGITFRTESNAAFLNDFTAHDQVTISIDVRVEDISMFGSPVPRDLIVDFRSAALAQGGFPWSSVWFTMTTMETGDDWATYEVTFDPNSLELPDGWGGYGAEDPVTFEPILPPDLTFADIMANTDQLAFTTLVPGFFFAFTDYDVRIDNIRVVRGGGTGPGPIPEGPLAVPVMDGPAPLALLILALLAIGGYVLRGRMA